ncbi:KAT8 regulatory NSL complex subunit 1 [Pectinophora gossypiella]|uniref:KAT8 regulatory NSL complex subunit 1 n=1 Tax=Pectinophora gossypiella TaxID=13191 RepID=UPI00214F4E1C|nr:KAT8 regulatory NSL complex subunit 1 [Pectinophora gossypiella]
MAPALSLPPREPYDHDAALETDKQLSQRRRALAPVDNLSTPMEEDDMGLQNQPSLAKDSQEMEQILVDLGSNDLVQADLLQAIKTLETGGDVLSTGDPDGIFPLAGFDLAEGVDSEGDAAEDKIRLMQARLDRRCAFLQRRLRILQARSIGKRVSEEAAQTFEKCTRGARKDGGGRPMGLKALLKRIETTSALQASAAARTVVGPKYYHAGSSKGDASRSASIGISSGTLTGLQDTAGALRSHLSVVKHELDSDATASSSGAESNDEAVTYNNVHQQHMPIEKRALWTWQRNRASIASRWSWLQAQIQELEYKIRQHNDLQKQVREQKGAVEFEGEPVSEPCELETLPDDAPALETCARVRPLRRDTFRKRKLLQMHNLHIATNKAAKPSDIRCSCTYEVESCSVCTGRAEPTEPAPPLSTLAPAERVARVDPGFHAVLSEPKDILPSVHMWSLLPRSWFRPRWQAAEPRRPAPPRLAATHKHTRRHPTRLKRGRPPLSRKIRERERDEESTSYERRGVGRASTESRARRQSYDIDNIVIPQSVAANTRPMILTYKEILTPKWRVLDLPEVSLNNGVVKSNRVSTESEDEDVSEAAVAARHQRAECRERARYVRAARPRRAHHDAAPAAPAAPHTPPPPPPTLAAPDPPTINEAVRPYTPRQFPLREETYQSMVQAMPEGYRRSPDHTPPSPRSPHSARDDDDDNSSTLSPLSPTPFDGDDPDDVEWDPSAEKSERRKSSFR